MTKIQHITLFIVLLLGVPYPLYGAPLESRSFVNDPREYAPFWKDRELLPDQDARVIIVQEVFQRLLSGLEGSAFPPELIVVGRGNDPEDRYPWASALADGSAILLSQRGMDICWNGGEKSKRHCLAFVLAHELSHRQAGHLWHRNFFKQAWQQKDPEVQAKIQGGLQFKQAERESFEANELQADRNGLKLMITVGFDPQHVLSGDGRFFYKWLESIRRTSCAVGSDEQVCQNTQIRVERLRMDWEDAARQFTIFNLGVQSFVGEDYEMARKFFTAYGRKWSVREIHNNIGLTHLSEAMLVRKILLKDGEDLGPSFIYPSILEGSLKLQKRSGTRSGMRSPENSELNRKMKAHLKLAIKSFERAITIDPKHRPSYWNLISAQFLSEKFSSATATTEDRYLDQFAPDATSSMFLAISAYFEGKRKDSLKAFNRALKSANESLIVTLRMNRVVFFRATENEKSEQAEWEALFRLGLKNRDEGLTRLALSHINNSPVPASSPKTTAIEKVGGYTLGQGVPSFRRGMPGLKKEEIEIEGKHIRLYHFENDVHLAVDEKRQIIALWQTGGEVRSAGGIKVGDDAAKVSRKYGLPSRHIRTLQGEFRSYDAQQVAFRFMDNKVVGWSLYKKQP